MRKTEKVVLWVVYKTALAGAPSPNAVCEQSEWDQMQRACPGHYKLIRKGITSEAEADRLARDAPGAAAVKGATLQTR